MSASHWHTVPLGTKRPLPDGDSDEDDDISLVSRSPSPPLDPMEVDQESIGKYDEYVNGAAREVITVETKIKSSNKGFSILAKLGWREGDGLGVSNDGRVDPVPFQMKGDSSGLGKISQDVRWIETTVAQRRELDSERQQKENDEQRKFREEQVARQSALNTELSDTLRAFYCELCDKQFKNVAQYDEHTNSYAHHHKARFKDMQANVRVLDQEEVNKRKEKERKREEKELRRMAAASGIRLLKTPNPVAAANLVSVIEKIADGSSPPPTVNDDTIPNSGFKRSGWSSVNGAATQASTAETTQPHPPLERVSPQPPAELPSFSPFPPSEPVGSPTVPPPLDVPLKPPSRAHQSRVGWQQFQKSNSRRR